jgi:hypothetical protein
VSSAKLPHGLVALAVLDRIIAGREPDYPIHGQTRCIACPQWVWLDAGSLQPVIAGDLLPVCRECAFLHIPGMSQIGRRRGNGRRR